MFEIESSAALITAGSVATFSSALNYASAGSISVLSCVTQTSTLSISSCVKVVDGFGWLPEDIWRSLTTVAFAVRRIR